MQGNSSEHIPRPGWYSLDLPRTLQIIVWISILVVFVLAFLDLTGWLFNITLLKSIMPQWIPMKIITAVCFIFAAIALTILGINSLSILRKNLPGVLAAFICFIGLITLYVYLYSLRTGHESSLTGVSYFKFFLAPVNRMSSLTAFNFLLIGCILLLLPADKTKTSGIAHVIIIPVSLINYFVIVSYILGVYSVNDLNRISIAMNTSIAFCAICVAVLLMRPDTWLLKVYTAGDTGGIIARQLLPSLMILPVVIGWLRIKGEHTALFKSEEGVVLVAIIYTVCFGVLVWLTARSVNKIDHKRRAIEEVLRESKEHLKSHLENSPLAVIEWEHNFVVTQWSVEAEHIFGWEKAEVIGRRIDELSMIFEEDLPIVEKTMERLSGGKELKIVSENRNYTKKREVRNCIWYNSVLLDVKGQMSSVMSLVEDVTETRKVEKELRSTKNYLENLINYANAPILVWNTNNEIRLFNNAFERLTGYSSVEVEGKNLDFLFPRASLKESNVKIKQALTKNWETIEIPILTKQNVIRTVLWNSANIYDTDNKTILSTIAQGNDITERIKAEQKVIERTKELELLNAKLLQELAERILIQDALKKSETQLKELNATKDKFFNIVAHDLKNPFTSLLGSSELLFENIHHLDTKSIQDLALILNDSAKSGYAILQNLLDWSRSQTGLLEINPERVNLRILINENISTLQLPAANKKIMISNKVKEDVFVFADKNMINTILRNILSNAVKFTYKSGKVNVTSMMRTNEVIVSIKDTGIGIPEDKIEKLFSIETKYSMPGTENEQGTGLGLKLSNEFVEKLGGRIWVESIADKGSEFKFTIPLKGGKA
jgi:PAS domain S-box-containing protein